jgi:transposase InsO family protein
MRREPFRTGEREKAKDILDTVHSNIIGPLSPMSMRQKKYVITFIDKASRYVTAVAIGRESETLAEFMKYKNRAEILHDKKIKELQTDQRTEYLETGVQRYLQKNGIQHRKSVIYTPQQNGLCEGLNRTLCNVIRCILIESGLPNSFWKEALQTACYMRNRCPSEVIQFRTPLEIWEGRDLKKENFQHMRVFGCRAWTWVPSAHQEGKFSPQARECVFLGYGEGIKGYLLWHKECRVIINSRDVTFQEHIFPYLEKEVRKVILSSDEVALIPTNWRDTG